MGDGADPSDARELSRKISGDLTAAKLNGMPVTVARYVAGRVAAGVVEVTFEAPTTNEALLASGVVAAILLREGYRVAPAGGRLLVVSPVEPEEQPAGSAWLSVVAPLGTP